MIFNYYHILNLKNNKEYIGITEKAAEVRFAQHKQSLKANNHANYLLQKDWNDYEEKDFLFELLETLEFESLEEGYDYEVKLIQNSKKQLYNLALGGLINPMYSQPVKEKMIETKQSAVPNIYQLKEISENVFQIVNKYNSQKEIQRLTGFNQGNISRSIKTRSCSYGYFWVNEQDIENNLLTWRPYRIKFSPTAEMSLDGQEVLKVHYTAREFEKEYNWRSGIISHAIYQNSRAHNKLFEHISEEEYYKILPLTLIK